jgi:hypothetical protein
MPCSICRQTGHNRSTCPRLNHRPQDQGLPFPPLLSSGPIARPIVIRNTVIAPQPERRFRVLKRWRKTIKNVINLKRYAYIVNKWSHLGYDDSRIYYPSYLKVKDLKGHLTDEITNHWKYMIYRCGRRRCLQIIPVHQCVRNSCFLLHRERNPEPVQVPTNQDLHVVNLVNLRDTNYLVYWVVGNYMVSELDTQVNNIKFMGLALKSGKFPLKTMTGHRFYLVPHRLDVAPPYHPETDKQFFIEPYLQINIHDGSGDTIYIDDKDKLSELNKWKFNALKLDYLLREVIKLGGKNNDVLECVLDLHEDIQLDTVNEWLKDVAGIPSVFTNLT